MVIKNEELLRQYAPAAFAEAPEEGRVSGRYSFLPTTDILEILQDEGWTAWKAQQVMLASGVMITPSTLSVFAMKT